LNKSLFNTSGLKVGD